jgi:hypothetical protein
MAEYQYVQQPKKRIQLLKSKQLPRKPPQNAASKLTSYGYNPAWGMATIRFF